MAMPARDFEFHPGSFVICEFTVGFDGYWAQICRSYSLGKPSPANMVLVSHPAIFVPQRGAAWVGGPFVIAESGNIPLDKPQTEIFEV
jgi:hypothetical protein